MPCSDDCSIPSSPSVRLNVFCLIAATAGLAALALPWTWTRAGLYYEETNVLVLYIDTLRPVVYYPDLQISMSLYVGGTLIAFLTPLGAIPQATGLTWFYLNELDRQESFSRYGYFEGGLAVGFLVACLSSILILVSLVRPMGIGYGGLPNPFLTRTKVASMPKTRLSLNGVLRVLRKNKSWMLAWAVAALLLGAIIAVVDYPYRTHEPLTEVEGGVMWVVDSHIGGYFPWNQSELSVNDSIQSVGWYTQSWSLANKTWASETYGARNLSDVILALTILDWSGDGRLDPGDSLIITTLNGTSFVDGVTYRVLVQSPLAPTDRSIFGYPRLVEITFEFHNGDLHSRVSVVPKWSREIRL
jgi:hypothetical protein